MRKRVFFVSDRTGLTVEALGSSLLTQFGDMDFLRVTLPFIDSIPKAIQVVAQVNEAHRESVPLGDIAVARIEQRVTGGVAVDHHTTTHPEVHAEHRPVIGVEEQLLAPTSGRDQRVTGECSAHAARGQAPLEVPAVRCIDGRDLTPERPLLDEQTRLLRFEDLGHRSTLLGRRPGATR